MKATVEGVQRGHFLIGPLSGRDYLWAVTKVNGRHSVQAMTHMDNMICEITLHTHNIHRDDSEWKRVKYAGETADEDVYAGCLEKTKFVGTDA